MPGDQAKVHNWFWDPEIENCRHGICIFKQGYELKSEINLNYWTVINEKFRTQDANTVPIARATSSLVWWSSMWMSPVAFTWTSNNPCEASC